MRERTPFYLFCNSLMLFHFPQIMARGLMHLCRFRQLLSWTPAVLGGVRFDEAGIHRQLLALHQPHLHTLPHDLLEQLLEQLRFLEPPVPVLGEHGVMRNLLIETQPGEPPPPRCIRSSSTSLRSLVMPYRCRSKECAAATQDQSTDALSRCSCLSVR